MTIRININSGSVYRIVKSNFVPIPPGIISSKLQWGGTPSHLTIDSRAQNEESIYMKLRRIYPEANYLLCSLVVELAYRLTGMTFATEAQPQMIQAIMPRWVNRSDFKTPTTLRPSYINYKPSTFIYSYSSTTTILSSLFKSLVTPSFIYHSSTTNLPLCLSSL